MDISVSLKGALVLREIYEGVLLKTKEDNELLICMRDGNIEMCVPGSDKWFRVEMETGDIKEM